MIATSGFLTSLNCTKFVFGPGPRWGSAPPDSTAGLRSPTSKGGKEKRGVKGEKR